MLTKEAHKLFDDISLPLAQAMKLISLFGREVPDSDKQLSHDTEKVIDHITEAFMWVRMIVDSQQVQEVKDVKFKFHPKVKQNEDSQPN